MRRNNTVSPLLWAALTLPVLYLAALLASGYEECFSSKKLRYGSLYVS